MDVTITINNLMSDGMKTNKLFNMEVASPANHLAKGNVMAEPEMAESMTKVPNNGGIYNGADGFIEGVVAYMLPDDSMSVIYFSTRGTSIDRIQKGAPLDDKLLKSAIDWRQIYTGSMVINRVNYVLTMNAMPQMSIDMRTMNIKVTVNVVSVSGNLHPMPPVVL